MESLKLSFAGNILTGVCEFTKLPQSYGCTFDILCLIPPEHVEYFWTFGSLLCRGIHNLNDGGVEAWWNLSRAALPWLQALKMSSMNLKEKRSANGVEFRKCCPRSAMEMLTYCRTMGCPRLCHWSRGISFLLSWNSCEWGQTCRVQWHDLLWGCHEWCF